MKKRKGLKKGKKGLEFSGEKLIFERLKRGLTQDDLGKKIGKKDGNEISRYERGDIRKPRPFVVKKIAEALGCEPQDLYVSAESTGKVPKGKEFIPVPFTPQEQNILKIFCQLEPSRQVKIAGYIEGWLASRSEQGAEQAALLAEAADQAQKATPGQINGLSADQPAQ